MTGDDTRTLRDKLAEALPHEDWCDPTKRERIDPPCPCWDTRWARTEQQAAVVEADRRNYAAQVLDEMADYEECRQASAWSTRRRRLRDRAAALRTPDIRQEQP